MARKRHSDDEIVNRHCLTEVELGKGSAVAAVCKQIGVTDQTYYKWRREYGGLKTDQAKRFKELECENARLKKLVADLSLIVMLRERKWTWVISDRYLQRLPWGHPCKMTPEGRPGWPLLTDMLEHAGYIERRRGQTWRMSKGGAKVTGWVQLSWQAAMTG